jgi:dolichol-phosphate mannosyltransferase
MQNTRAKEPSSVVTGENSHTSETPWISIVVPAYNEEESLPILYRELQNVSALGAIPWELIIVDDGSTDQTWKVVARLHLDDPRVNGLRFSRNFGHQYAILAGIRQSRGRAVITMDADLQHPPQLISRLVEEWQKGSMVVQTARVDPLDLPISKRWTSRLFYRVFSYLTGLSLSPGMADYRLLDRKVVTELLRSRECGLFLRGLIAWMGYPASTIEYECGQRIAGQTKYHTGKMLKLAWNGLTSFSLVPLRLAIFLGIVASLFAFSQIFYAFWAKLSHEPIPGWTSVVVILSFLLGILFIEVGILGEYIWQILEIVRKRPLFIICEDTRWSGLPR